MELIYLILNTKFDMSVIFMINYFFNEKRPFRRQLDDLDDRLRES
jgi:hypothetical protein